ncbi:MAG: hypothetical protein ACE5IC_06070 [Candidatus Brocadiales bacterium]
MQPEIQDHHLALVGGKLGLESEEVYPNNEWYILPINWFGLKGKERTYCKG